MEAPGDGPHSAAQLVLGPLLRHVGAQHATIWVETDRPCEVRILDAVSRTFAAHGHHYAVVVVEDLQPASSTPYTVELDGRQVWPPTEGEGAGYPQSRIRTVDTSRPFRLSFGTCRTSVPHTPLEQRRHGVDVMRARAHQMAAQPETDWPDLLLLVGDQVYADETSDEMQRFIRARRDISEPPGEELADFEEYTHLYRLAWSDPANRWLFSTLASAMIFDDHDIRDDWNTSDIWRRKMAEKPWWQARIVGGIGSYWLYQHLGNLHPEELATDPLLARLRGCEGDGGEILDEFARGADRDPPSNRWSYVRDLGRAKLVVIDTRCGRVLAPHRRAMLDDREWAWVDGQLRGDVDHLLVGSSLPYLLPTGIHHVEGWNEAVCAGAWGRRAAGIGERIRQGVDLEHWASFRRSFDAMARIVAEVATGKRGRPPATVTFLSGDVHYSYLARALVPGQGRGSSRIYQAVCSPIRNPLPRLLRYANGAAQFGLARLVGWLLVQGVHVRDPDISWDIEQGPWFDNALATLELDGRAARLRWDRASTKPDGSDGVQTLFETRLS